jgi:iron complex transport system ATP-binding protein
MSNAPLEIRSVNISRSGKLIVDGVNLTFPPFELTGLVGPNGAGKSTLLGAIAGKYACSGQIRHGTAPINRNTLSFLPQAHGIATSLTALEVVLLGRRDVLGWRAGGEDIDLAGQALSRFGIADLAWRRMDTLSGGQQQIVLLAQRLVRSPSIVLLDEPTSALDLHHQLSVLAILREYAQSHGAVVICALHDLGLAGRQCDRVAMLQHGKLRAEGMPEDVLTDENITSVYRISTEIYRNASGHRICVPVAAIGTGNSLPNPESQPTHQTGESQ